MKQLLFNFYELPRIVFDWVRVLVHCLVKFHTNLKGEDHRMCKVQAYNTQKKIMVTYHFCSCEYLVNEIPDEELRDQAALLNKIGNMDFQ